MDPEKTSPYEFYQFWLNSGDADCENYIKIFSLKGQEELEGLISEHQQDPGRRQLQKALADEITTRVHGDEELEKAKQASQILFGKATEEALRTLDERTLVSVFAGVSQGNIKRTELDAEIEIVTLLADHTSLFNSKGEARRMVQGNGISINKSKVKLDKMLNPTDLINDKYILIQKGKKDYFLLIVD